MNRTEHAEFGKKRTGALGENSVRIVLSQV